jgi:quaternary ammonium compound-resistance protein SugE
MAWTFLFIAGIFEIIFALSLKYTQGFSRLAPSVVTVVAGAASVVILSQSVKALPVGAAYAMWTGIGAVGTAVLGMWLFNEPRDVARLVCIGLIISGIVGLSLTSTAAE